MANKNILILVEGAKTDLNLMQKLFKAYNLDEKYDIVPYKTNIYTLYKQMFEKKDEYLDLIQVLKEHSITDDKILNKKFSDIILIFDLDPQDNLFSIDKIKEMSNFFDESTENGKLYINYPMVESFCHLTSIIDADFIDRTVYINEITNYKFIVNKFCQDPNKLLKNRQSLDKLILLNYKKSKKILNEDTSSYYCDLHKILETQIDKMNNDNALYVLCTCILFILDYNPKLIGMF